jgi:hypothetical protein
MIIINKKQENGVLYIKVEKSNNNVKLGDECKKFKYILTENADVYDENDNILLKYRKNVLPDTNIDNFVEAISGLISKPSGHMRGKASGDDYTNIISTVIGYFDNISIEEYKRFKKFNITPQYKARITKFTRDNPDKMKGVYPLIKNINDMYKKLAPAQYKYQKSLAEQTGFKFKNTVFSTMTINKNFKTNVHTDKGNAKDTLGNLVVIENGKYGGSYTGYPEYDIGVDMRTGDFLLMNIHKFHCNTPFTNKKEGYSRIALVSYLRNNFEKGTTIKDLKKLEKESLKVLNLTKN